MGINPPWNWRVTVLNQDDAGQITNDRVQDDRQSWLLFLLVLHAAPLSVYTSSCALIVMGWGVVDLWTSIRLPDPWLPATKITQTFLSTSLASLMVFEWRAAGAHFQLRNHCSHSHHPLVCNLLTQPVLVGPGVLWLAQSHFSFFLTTLLYLLIDTSKKETGWLLKSLMMGKFPSSWSRKVLKRDRIVRVCEAQV